MRFARDAFFDRRRTLYHAPVVAEYDLLGLVNDVLLNDVVRRSAFQYEEIGRNAYSNSSFFSGTYQELKQARFFSERKPSPSNLDGLTR